MNRTQILVDIRARSGAPIVCDLSGTADTPEERLAAYRRLFATSLVDRRREAQASVWVFEARRDVVDQLSELMRREAACCPFVDYRLIRVGDLVEFAMASDDPAVADILDLVYDLPRHQEEPADELAAALIDDGASGSLGG